MWNPFSLRSSMINWILRFRLNTAMGMWCSLKLSWLCFMENMNDSVEVVACCFMNLIITLVTVVALYQL